jgi:hypothetical protein
MESNKVQQDLLVITMLYWMLTLFAEQIFAALTYPTLAFNNVETWQHLK